MIKGNLASRAAELLDEAEHLEGLALDEAHHNDNFWAAVHVAEADRARDKAERLLGLEG